MMDTSAQNPTIAFMDEAQEQMATFAAFLSSTNNSHSFASKRLKGLTKLLQRLIVQPGSSLQRNRESNIQLYCN
jgi:hypothetical protein